MSSTAGARPVVTLYPSTQEDVNAYMAAIRLASSVRNSMDAQKSGADGEKAAVNADSYGRHHPNFPSPPPANLEAVPTLNHTSSAADFASNATKSSFVHPRDSHPPSSHYVVTGTLPLLEERASAAAANLSTLANTSTSAVLEGLGHHHGFFPPPNPPTGTGAGPVLEDTAADTPAGVKREVMEDHHGYFPPPDPPMRTDAGSILEEITASIPTGVKRETLEEHQGYFPAPDPPMNTGAGPILEGTTADTPAGVKREVMEDHHGYFPPPDPPMRTDAGSILEEITASIPTGVKRETPEEHQGYFPPPDHPQSTETGPIPAKANHGSMTASIDPPIGAAQDSNRIRRRLSPPPGKPISAGTGPIAIELHDDHMLLPNSTTHLSIPPECQLYVTNTDVHNLTFAICPPTNTTTNTTTTNLASPHLHPENISTPHNILATRDTATTCDAPTGFNQRLLCGHYDTGFAFAFFFLFSIIGLAWIVMTNKRNNKNRTRTRDVEQQQQEYSGNATWPVLANVSSSSSTMNSTTTAATNNSAKAEKKASEKATTATNGSVAKLKEKVRKSDKGEGGLGGERGSRAEEYEAVAWRSASSRRAERAVLEGRGRVERDAGPVSLLPDLPVVGLSL